MKYRVIKQLAACLASLVVIGAAVGNADMSAAASKKSSDRSGAPNKAGVDKKASVKRQQIAFGDIPGWDADDHVAALQAFRKSCARLTARRAAALGEGFQSACLAARDIDLSKKGARSKAKAFFEANFVPHKLAHNGPNGLVTGYFEPVLVGSRRRHGPFQVPVYKRPPDLMNLVSESDRATVGSGLTHARRDEAGKIAPFATRAEIEQGALAGKGLELIYLADPVETYFMHVQGSGRIDLIEGGTIRITYDGKNGHPYSSIGMHLIKAGTIGADRMSLKSLADWLRSDPARGREVMWHNRSFIFFRELTGEEAAAPMGVDGISLSEGRSLAIDPRYHQIGLPVFVEAPAMKHVNRSRGLQRLMIAQDVGSAIKGPERGDVYFGSGEAAEKKAGVTKHPARFIVLLPKAGRVASTGGSDRAAGRSVKLAGQ